MSNSVRPHRQPTRLRHPWDSPGKKTGVGCHFLLQHMKVKSESEVARSCPTLHDPEDCSPPGSFIHGIFQARVLEWVAIALTSMRADQFSCSFSRAAEHLAYILYLAVNRAEKLLSSRSFYGAKDGTMAQGCGSQSQLAVETGLEPLSTKNTGNCLYKNHKHNS